MGDGAPQCLGLGSWVALGLPWMTVADPKALFCAAWDGGSVQGRGRTSRVSPPTLISATPQVGFEKKKMIREEEKEQMKLEHVLQRRRALLYGGRVINR